MKKIIKKIYTVLYRIFFLFFDFLIDFLFCIRLFISLRDSKEYDEYKIKNIKVLLQFFGRSFDSSSFEYYNLYKEDSMYLLHLSLQKKNSLIFQIFCFFYCFIVEYFLLELVYILLPYNNFRNKLVDNTFEKWFNILKKQIENNFGFIYSRVYKIHYYKDKSNRSITKFKIFYFEFLLGLICNWNEVIIRNNHRNIFFIDTIDLFRKFNGLFIDRTEKEQEQLEEYFK